MLIPKVHQLEFSDKCWEILKELGYVYLAGKPRSGKTYTAIMTAEKSTKISRVLVLCPKNAIPGWHKFTKGNALLQHTYYVTNYEQVGRIIKGEIVLKLNPNDYDLVIIDESHNYGVIGKPTQRYKTTRALCYNMPHIHLSGTAIVESQNGIYHQMTISEYTPFHHKNFYDFFREFGDPYWIKAGGREINQYDRSKDTLLPIINLFTVYMTQEDAGISKELQAVDILRYIELEKFTTVIYNKIVKDKVVNLQDFGITPDFRELVCDSVMKERTSLHMLEQGIVKITISVKDLELFSKWKNTLKLSKEDGLYYVYLKTGNTEKIDYILANYGDFSSVGVMSHFVGERELFKQFFKNIQVFSSTSDAEGVDLSHLEHYIISSSDYKGAKFIQRKDRTVNTEGSNTLDVNHLLVKKAVSEQIYKQVSKKDDFNNATYSPVTL
jgi:hypothetical protein